MGGGFAGCLNQGESGTRAESATPSGEIVSEFVSSRTVEYRAQTNSLVTKSGLRYYNPETGELDTLSPQRDIFIQCYIEIENLGEEPVSYPNLNEFSYWTPSGTFPLLNELPSEVSWENLRPEGSDITQPNIGKTLPLDELNRSTPTSMYLLYDVPERPSPHHIKWSAETDPERDEPLYFQFRA
jgi:hypothetical protein